MELNFVDANTEDFDSAIYLKLLVAVAKSDPDNGPPEYNYVKTQANRLGLDIVKFWNDTPKHFLLDGGVRVSRLTALVIIKDSILLAILDGNFSFGEKEKVYRTAEKLDIPRSDVDRVEKWLDAYRQLRRDWDSLVEA
jgi:hypothetical protein